MISALALQRLVRSLLIAASLAIEGGCRPSKPTTTEQDQLRQTPTATQSSADMRHHPESDDLARFLCGKLPPFIKLVELKSDPPVPQSGTTSSNNAWIYNVRVTFAPPEDVLRPTAPKDAAAFRSAVDELNTLAAWSQVYARSLYASRYPCFSVDPPMPAHPLFLAVAHPKNKPLASLYGKMSAEWQVDHWNYEVVSLQDLPNEPGKLRSQYTGPILIQGSPEAEQFMAQVKAGLDAARPKKAAIDAAYHADLLAATRPGMTYKGQLVHGKNALLAEARFLAAAPGDEPNQLRMEFRLPESGYIYLCSVHLAKSPPVQLAIPNQEVEGNQSTWVVDDSGPAPEADLAMGYLHVTDPKSSRVGTPASDFRSATMSTGVENKFWLSIQNRRLTGKMTLYEFNPPYLFDSQQVP